MAALDRALALAERDDRRRARRRAAGSRRGGAARRSARRRRGRRRRPPSPRAAPRRAPPRARPGSRTTRIPRPPPPAAALTTSGKPISSGSPSGTTGTPASRAIRFASSLSPPDRSASGGGPTQVRPAASTASAKSGVLGEEAVAGMDRVRAGLAAPRACAPRRRGSAEISTVSSAERACSEPESSSGATATVAIPSSRQVRKTRTAISPRFATRSFRMPTTGRASRGTRAGPPGPPRSSRRLGDAPLGAEAVRALEHEPLRLRAPPRARPSAARPRSASTAASRSSATSCTRPIRSAVAASNRSPVRKYRRAAPGPIFAQRERRDDRGDDPELDLGEPEDARRARRRDVGARDEAAAAAERVARAPGRRPARGSESIASSISGRGGARPRRSPRSVRSIDAALPLDVGSRAEALALAGEHDRARVARRPRTPRSARGSARRRTRCAAPGRAIMTLQEVAALLHAQRCHLAEHRKVASAMLRGALAAAVTPLRDEGAALDEDAFGPYLDFLAAAGLDGILALGTTGEGILLSAAERQARRGAVPRRRRCRSIVHCGAQTTAETVRARRARSRGRGRGVAVIAPPYFALDDSALLAHLRGRGASGRSAAVLRLRVQGRERLRGAAAPCSSGCASARRTSPG